MLAAKGHTIPHLGESTLGIRAAKQIGPRDTVELRRVANLPTAARPEGLDLTDLFAKHDGAMSLRAIQSQAIAEAVEARGLLGFVGVGHGKTLICELLPVALELKRPVLLVPAAVKTQLLRYDRPLYGRHFNLHPNYPVIAYEELSLAKNTDLLERIAPDGIIADEAHNLRHRDAARTRRFLRFMQGRSEVVFCALSGTLLSRSILDVGHLAALALGEGSPFPLDRWELATWAAALDSTSQNPTGPGALVRFAAPELTDAERATLDGEPTQIDHVRIGFRRRLLATPGVIASGEGSIEASIHIAEAMPKVPAIVQTAIAALDRTWSSPGGDELEDAIAFSRVAKELSQGFYYKWVWPTCVPCGGKRGQACDRCYGLGYVEDRDWLEARSEWHKACREYLKRRARAGFDSPFLLAAACDRGEMPDWVAEPWEAWKAVKHRPAPPVTAVWLDRFLIDFALDWAKQGPGILWFEHTAVGEALEAAGIETFGAGPVDRRDIQALAAGPEGGKIPIACSIRSHGTGKNLQAWNRNLFLSVPSGGTAWEQTLGRTHRAGQAADLVTAEVCRHTQALRDAFEAAERDARFQEQLDGSPRKLTYGRILWK